MSRSGFYYKGVAESSGDLLLKRLIDEEYTKHPFYGSRKLAVFLQSVGHPINRKHVQRLMREMGLEVIYPKPRTSIVNPEHRVYPYLLKGLKIVRCNQVWSIDITYIRLKRGFVYLVAVIDWFSRYVLSWGVSNTMDVCFCLEALEKALIRGTPDIFNSDQGSQFTSLVFTDRLKAGNILISMDSVGRALDNIFVERLWRSVKYEEVYLRDYETMTEAIQGLGRYFQFYNEERFHQSLNYKTPKAIHIFGR